MITLMLNDLRDPSGISLPVLFPACVLVLHLDVLIPRRLPNACQGQTALLRLIRRVFLNNHRVIHHNIHDALLSHPQNVSVDTSP